MEISKLFNEARITYADQILTTAELQILFENLPYGNTSLFINTLADNKCLQRIKRGKFKFTSEPIHHSLIEKSISHVREVVSTYNKKSRNKKVDHRSDIQKAIDLLLSTGEYEIYHVEKVVKKTQIF